MPFLAASNYVTAASTVTASGWTLGAGSNRIVALVWNHEEGNQSRYFSAVSFGGVACEYHSRGIGGTGANNDYVEIWIIKEANVGSISADPVITVTPAASATNAQAVTVFTLTDCDQTTANWTATPTNIWTDVSVGPLSTSLTSTTGGVIIGGMTCSSQTNGFTCDSPLVEVTSSDRAFNSSSRAVTFYYDVVSGSSQTVGGDNANTTSGVTQNIYAINIPVAATNPTITSLTGTPRDGGQFTINGTNFEASQGTGGVTIDGDAVTVDSWSDTAITVTVSGYNGFYDTNVNMVVTNNSAEVSSNYVMQVDPPTGFGAVVLVAPLASAGVRLEALPDLEADWQVAWGDYIGTGTGSVLSDGSYGMDYTVRGFYFKYNDTTGWSSLTLQLIGGGFDTIVARDYTRDCVRDCVRDALRG